MEVRVYFQLVSPSDFMSECFSLIVVGSVHHARNSQSENIANDGEKEKCTLLQKYSSIFPGKNPRWL